MKGISFVNANERCLLPSLQKMSNQYLSNLKKKEVNESMNAWQFVVPSLFGMIFCDLLERFSEVTLNHLVIVFVKIQRSTNLFNVKELKESHQKTHHFSSKKFPQLPPGFNRQLASFRSPCIPGFNRLQVKGRPRLKSMPKGLAS